MIGISNCIKQSQFHLISELILSNTKTSKQKQCQLIAVAYAEFTPVIHNGISKNIRVALKVKYNVTESLLG
ncbi:hypothetical protein VCHA54P499_300032 [Vibrio chagasii]|nr:hypothetical protein VCHA54P499_300032 [Vibrio chagasii]CAH7271229.1 hypothetical protein VCHA53O466_340004 [Vibrio chagasii]